MIRSASLRWHLSHPAHRLQRGKDFSANRIIWWALLLFVAELFYASGSAATIRYPQFSGDGKSVYFDYCNEGRGCLIHNYNIETRDLGFYRPPPGKNWTMASPSRAGDKLVFVEMLAVPAGRRFSDMHREVLTSAQIVEARIDGSGFRQLTHEPGLKIFPSFSRSGDKVLFNRAEKIRDSGATAASDYDLWEVDVTTGATRMFAGLFRFSDAGRSFYVDDGESALANAGVPFELLKRQGISVSEYSKKANNKEIYIVRRNATTLSDPLFIDVSSAYQASRDDNGAMLFFAQRPKEGMKIHRSQKGQITDSWPFPPAQDNEKGRTPLGASVSPDGRFLAVAIRESPMISYFWTRPSETTYQLFLLDIEKGQWREIHLPKQARQINP